MTVLVSCNGQEVIGELPYGADAPAACRQAERERNDGFCVVAWNDGRIVADGDGWHNEEYDDGLEYRLAIDRACGYAND